MNKSQEIQRNWYDLLKACPLSTMEIWDIEHEITDILYDKGYDFVNFNIAPCQYGRFNALSCLTKVVGKLAGQITENGFEVIVVKNPRRPSESWIVFPYNLTHEIRSIVDDFEVIT